MLFIKVLLVIVIGLLFMILFVVVEVLERVKILLYRIPHNKNTFDTGGDNK